MNQPLVGIVMGSNSDLDVMREAADILEQLGVHYELTVISAHRTPERMLEYAQKARERGLKVIIAGAGGAAHLPGMIASVTTLPVIGVPIRSSNSIDGWDSVLSILQMPSGVPVATVALDNATNAAVLAAQILALSEPLVQAKLKQHKDSLRLKVEESIKKLEDKDLMED